MTISRSRKVKRIGAKLYSLPLAVILFGFIIFYEFILLFTSPVTDKINPNHSTLGFRPKYGHLKFASNLYNVSDVLNIRTNKSTNQSERLSVPVILSTGSDDLDYPLKIDMPNLVQNILSNQSVHVQPINDPHFNFIISNKHKCQELNNKPPDLLILIKSAPINILRRDSIRLTWGNERCWGGRQVVRIFLLGSAITLDSKSQNLIKLESEQYGDIVQQDFIDTYYNNTYKTMLGFEWAIRFCSEAPFIMFVDDDFFVYPKNIVAYLEGLSDALKHRLISGYVWRNSIPIRNMKNAFMKKWLIEKSEYMPDIYPPYIAGGNFFISMNLARKLEIAIRYTRFLRFDDVFLGIVLRKLLYTPIHQSQIYIEHTVDDNRINWTTVFSIHNYKTIASQLSLWTRLNCSSFCTD